MTRTTRDQIHHNGPGLKVLSPHRWFGGGYCGICGESDEVAGLVPRCVRYWDPDDGWKVGILCVHCAPHIARRGPQPDDSAYPRRQRQVERITAYATEELGSDLDDLIGEDC